MTGTIGSLAMIEDQCADGTVILKRTGENIRYCKVNDVESIGQEVRPIVLLVLLIIIIFIKEQHCLLLIEPSQLKNTSLTKLHPIVIFLYTNKPNHLSKCVYVVTSSLLVHYLEHYFLRCFCALLFSFIDLCLY